MPSRLCTIGRAVVRRAAWPSHVEASFLRALRIAGQHKDCHYASRAAFSRALRCSASGPSPTEFSPTDSTRSVIQSRHAMQYSTTPSTRPGQPNSDRSQATISSQSLSSLKDIYNGNSVTVLLERESQPDSRSAGPNRTRKHEDEQPGKKSSDVEANIEGVGQPLELSERATPNTHPVSTLTPYILQRTKRRRLDGRIGKREPSHLTFASQWQALYEQLSNMTAPAQLTDAIQFELFGDRKLVEVAQKNLSSLSRTVAGNNMLLVTADESDKAEAILRVVGSPLFVLLARDSLLAMTNPEDTLGPLWPTLDVTGVVKDTLPWDQEGLDAEPAQAFQDEIRHLMTARTRNHREEIPANVVEAFRSLSTRPEAASKMAFVIGLKFLLHRRKFAEVREVWRVMEELRLEPCVDIYNLILASCIEDRHYRTLKRYLGMMSEAGVRPNAGTWMILMRLATRAAERDLVIRKLALLGYLDLTGFLKKAIGEIVQHVRKKDLKEGIARVLQLLDTAMGPSWVNDQTVWILIHELCRKRLIKDAVAILEDLIVYRGFTPSSSHLTHLLVWCNRLGLIEDAIAILRQSHMVWKKAPEQRTTLRLFFAMAKRYHLLNVGKVVWKHFQTTGRTPRSIRMFVRESLLASMKSEMHFSPKQRFRHAAGRVFVGREELVRAAKESRSPEQVVGDIFRAERPVIDTMQPRHPLYEDLARALAKDRQWDKPGINDPNRRTDSPSTLAGCAVDVELRTTRIFVPQAPSLRMLKYMVD